MCNQAKVRVLNLSIPNAKSFVQNRLRSSGTVPSYGFVVKVRQDDKVCTHGSFSFI